MADEWNALCVALVATADLSSSDLVSNIGQVTLHTRLALRTTTNQPPPNYFVHAAQRIAETRSNKIKRGIKILQYDSYDYAKASNTSSF